MTACALLTGLLLLPSTGSAQEVAQKICPARAFGAPLVEETSAPNGYSLWHACKYDVDSDMYSIVRVEWVPRGTQLPRERIERECDERTRKAMERLYVTVHSDTHMAEAGAGWQRSVYNPSQLDDLERVAAILLRAVEPYAARCPGHDPEPPSWPRQHLCDLGQSLGQAAARERLFGEAFGPDLPAQQVSAIATHMSDAAAALEAAEAGFQPPFSQQRPADSIRSLLRDMRGYGEWRTGRSPQHRYQEIDGIFGRYQRTLSYTFDSSRTDATHYQPNCDSYTIAACYHLGRASIAAAIAPGDRRAVGADTFQSGANAAMTTAIQEGMDVAVDAPREPTTLEVCCSFGSPEAWAAVPRLQPDSPASAYRTAREVVEAAVASAAPRNCGGYPGVGGSSVAGTGEGATGSYERGRALWDEDPRQAYRLVRQAAEAGNARAQLSTGVALFTGHGTASDEAAAAEWFRRAAEQGNAQAQQNLGQIYISGQGVPRDYEEAVRWTRRAAEQGHPEAQRSLGYAYQIGRGVARDCDQAVTWYRRAADSGDATALNDLGYLHENGICVPQDYAAAADWYERGTAENLPIAITNLAELYESGLGRPRDEQRALELYRRAARLGGQTAQRVLRERGLDW